MLTALQDKEGTNYGWNIIKYIVSQEEHKTEGLHLHLYIEGDKRWDILKADFLDVQDEDGNTYHGHWETCRSPAKVKSYCKKEGQFITNMKFNLMAEVVQLAKEGKAQEAFDRLAEEEPRLVITQASRLKDSIALLGEDKQKEWVPRFTEFENLPDLLDKWEPSKHSLLLVGESEFGKTYFAMWLMRPRPLMVSCREDLKQLRGWHTGLVFDDFKPYKWRREDAIHMTDVAFDRGVEVKYGKITIPAGLDRIFVANENPFPADMHKAIERRVFTVKIREPLFDTSKQPQGDKHAPDDWQETMKAKNGPYPVVFQEDV